MSEWSLSTASALFKRKYDKQSDAVFNAGNPVLSQLKVNEKFVGSDLVVNNPMGFSGSVGSGVLPKANAGKYENAILSSKRCYATMQVEREALKASATDEGAFVRMMKEPTKKALESFQRNRSRMLFNDGTGILGKGDAAAADVTGLGTVGSPFVVTFAASKFHEGFWEEKDYVQVVTGIDALGESGTAEGGDAETNLLEVVEVDVENKKVKLVGTSAVLAARVAAPAPLGATDAIVMQRSYLRDLQGLRGVSLFSELYDLGTLPGGKTLYSIAPQRRWKMFVKDAAAAALTKPLMNTMALTVEKRTGKTINLIASSFEQFQKLLDLSEDQKRYPIMPRNEAYKKAIYSFEGVEYMTTTGPVPVVADRMVKKDEIFFLNTDYIEYYLRPGGAEWAQEDGTIFLRVTGYDSYEARYCMYGECLIIPPFHAHLKNLAA